MPLEDDALKDFPDIQASSRRPPHRPEVDDLGTLLTLAWLRLFRARSDLSAAKMMADVMPCHHSKEATWHRLRRKLKDHRTTRVGTGLAFLWPVLAAASRHESLFAQEELHLPAGTAIMNALRRADPDHPAPELVALVKELFPIIEAFGKLGWERLEEDLAS
jgi:hypothetical protein